MGVAWRGPTYPTIPHMGRFCGLDDLETTSLPNYDNEPIDSPNPSKRALSWLQGVNSRSGDGSSEGPSVDIDLFLEMVATRGADAARKAKDVTFTARCATSSHRIRRPDR